MESRKPAYECSARIPLRYLLTRQTAFRKVAGNQDKYPAVDERPFEPPAWPGPVGGTHDVSPLRAQLGPVSNVAAGRRMEWADARDPRVRVEQHPEPGASVVRTPLNERFARWGLVNCERRDFKEVSIFLQETPSVVFQATCDGTGPRVDRKNPRAPHSREGIASAYRGDRSVSRSSRSGIPRLKRANAANRGLVWPRRTGLRVLDLRDVRDAERRGRACGRRSRGTHPRREAA